jgi:serine/threonine protein kinase
MAADQTAISRPKPADFIPGYRLEKLVGKGGMGEVHQAVQLSLGRTVAVKLLASELASDDSFVARWRRCVTRTSSASSTRGRRRRRTTW